MRNSQKPTSRQLTLVATLRAAGVSWVGVGKELSRNPKTVQGWIEREPERWQRAYRKARRQLVDDVLAESVTILRQDLRDAADAKARRDSASKLIRYAAMAKKPGRSRSKANDPKSASSPLKGLEFIASLTNEQRLALIRDLGFVPITPLLLPSPPQSQSQSQSHSPNPTPSP